MSRYRKYIEIIDKLDKALEEKGLRLLEGKVTPENLDFLEKILCVMDKAWCVAWQVDRLDDIGRAMSRIAQKGEGPDQEAVQALSGGSAGKDFRGGREYTGAEAFGGYPAGFWPPAGGDTPLTPESEESRRRRRAYAMARAMDQETARRGRRAMDMSEPEQDFIFLPGVGAPSFFASRMGYDVDPYHPEENTPYSRQGNGGNGGNSGGSGGQGGRTRSGIQGPVQNAGQTGNSATQSAAPQN